MGEAGEAFNVVEAEPSAPPLGPLRDEDPDAEPPPPPVVKMDDSELKNDGMVFGFADAAAVMTVLVCRMAPRGKRTTLSRS